MMSNNSSRPLDGVRIIETASFLTGPMAGQILADLGADVIKVEPPSGDQFRRFGHRKDGWSAMWTSTNRGKRSIVLDLKSPGDLETMKALLAEADVLLENWRPHVASSLGLGQEEVRALNPRIIRLSISGAGATGPLARKPAFDPLIQGRTGMASLRQKADRPELAPYDVVDKIVGTFGAQTILAALYQREKTGIGSDMSLPMLDVMTYFNFPDMFQHRTFVGDETPRAARPSPVVATSDGHLIITPVSGSQMSRALEALGIPEVKAELRAIEHYPTMLEMFYQRLGEVMATNTNAHWIAVFDKFDVACGPVLSLEEHLSDPQVENNKLYFTVDSPVGPIRAVRYPATFNAEILEPLRPPPEIDEHGREILDQLKAG